MIVDGKGQIFEDRRKKQDRRKEDKTVENDRRKVDRRKENNKIRK